MVPLAANVLECRHPAVREFMLNAGGPLHIGGWMELRNGHDVLATVGKDRSARVRLADKRRAVGEGIGEHAGGSGRAGAEGEAGRTPRVGERDIRVERLADRRREGWILLVSLHRKVVGCVVYILRASAKHCLSVAGRIVGEREVRIPLIRRAPREAPRNASVAIEEHTGRCGRINGAVRVRYKVG